MVFLEGFLVGPMKLRVTCVPAARHGVGLLYISAYLRLPGSLLHGFVVIGTGDATEPDSF